MANKDSGIISPALRSLAKTQRSVLIMLIAVSALTSCMTPELLETASIKADPEHVSLLAADGTGLNDPALFSYEYDAAANLSIRQLIEVGSQAVGPWPLGGLGWPAQELFARSGSGETQAVIDATKGCLAAPAIADNSHSFCAYVLGNIDPSGVDDTFITNFSQLNSRGQHEVLIYAYEFSKPEYAPLLGDALDRITLWPERDPFPFLVALYSLDHYQPDLHQAVSRYYTRFRQEIEDYARWAYLNGFPYSDVVTLSVDNIPLLFASAVEFGDNMALIVDRVMTAEEQQLLGNFHVALEQTERVDLPARERTLTSLVEELNDVFREQVFTVSSSLVAGDELITYIGGSQISAPEILVQLCNQYDLDIRNGSSPYGWQIGSPLYPNNLALQNNCSAHGNFLTRLEVSGGVNGTPIHVSVRLHSGNKAIGFLRPQFLKTTLTPGDLDINSPQRRLYIKSATIRIPVRDNENDATDPDPLPAFSLGGTITFNVPASFHQLQQTVLPGMTDFELIHGPFKLQYLDEAEAIRIFLSSTTCCSEMSNNLPMFNTGSVKLFNDAGEIIAEGFTPYVNYSRFSSSGAVYLAKQSRNFSQPVNLVWTVAPTLKPYRFDIEFNDVRLIRVPTEEAGPVDQQN